MCDSSCLFMYSSAFEKRLYGPKCFKIKFKKNLNVIFPISAAFKRYTRKMTFTTVCYSVGLDHSSSAVYCGLVVIRHKPTHSKWFGLIEQFLQSYPICIFLPWICFFKDKIKINSKPMVKHCFNFRSNLRLGFKWLLTCFRHKYVNRLLCLLFLQNYLLFLIILLSSYFQVI